jgi:polysaccharide deacetylase 2 family uncharacterized protein YibQ
MPDERHDRLTDPFYPPPPARRGSFIGGPGIIFVFLLLLIAAGIGIYGAATGTLSQWVEALRQQDLGALLDQQSPPSVAGPPPAADPAEAGTNPLVFTPMGPSELMTTRTPPRSLHLPAGAFDDPPVKRFARPALFLGQKPRLAIVIANLGHNQAVTAAAIADTPPEITLSFSPYAPELAAWIAAAHAFGHEAMLDLPLESRAYPQDDPGALGLVTALNPDENARRLDELVKRADGTIGFATQRGDRFLSDAASLSPVLTEIAARGLGLLVTTPGLQEADRQAGSRPPGARADSEFGHDLSRQAIAEGLNALLMKAQKEKQAIATVQPYPASIAALTTLGTLTRDRIIALVPVSALLSKE